jgi:hypothetical protein
MKFSNSMRQGPYVRERYRRILAIAGFVGAFAITACGMPAAGANNSPVVSPAGPVTADSVRAAFDNSTMQNGHFRLHGTIIKNRTYFPVTGDGVYQLRPREALLMNLSVQTFSSLGVLRMQEIAIGTRIYVRIGTGKWASKRESASATLITTYIGEEIIGTTAVWHAQSLAGRSVYDIWIREDDGYPVQLSYKSTSGNLTMNFNTYNKSAVINVPK